MTGQTGQPQHNSDRFLLWAAIAYTAGSVVHGLDHAYRGASAAPPVFMMIGGSLHGLLVALAAALVFTHHPRAPVAAIVVGFGTVPAFTFFHLLPTIWPASQDSFVSPSHVGPTWFSWIGAVTEIGTGIILGFAGVRAACGRSSQSDSPVARSETAADASQGAAR